MIRVSLKRGAVESELARKCKSQNWLAYRMRISSGYLSQVMNGVRGASPRIREKLLGVLQDLKFDDLFEIVPDPRSGKSSPDGGAACSE